MSSTAIIICLIGIALAIVLNYKFGVNMGVTGLAVAWIAGCIVMGLKVKDVVALWPNSVVFQLMSITLFFGFAVVNGTMQAIANHLLYKVRNQTWMIAFAIFFIGFILGALGCPPSRRQRYLRRHRLLCGPARRPAPHDHRLGGVHGRQPGLLPALGLSGLGGQQHHRRQRL